MNDTLQILNFIAVTVNIIFITTFFIKNRNEKSLKSQKELEIQKLQELEEQRNKNFNIDGFKETDEERDRRIIFTNAAEKLINDKESTIGKLISDQGLTINTLNEDTRRMIQNTDRLTNILNNPKRTGKFGEMNLRSLLDLVEFKENIHYLAQKQISNGKIPDFTFKLPENKVVHVDCKFSVSKAFETYQNLNSLKINLDEETNDKRYEELEKNYNKEVKDFVDKMKGHIDDVYERGYSGADENTLDFVFLYIPTESSYAFLIEQRISYQEKNNKFDIPLIQYALQKDVVITNPSLMMAYLNTIKRSLLTHNLAENIKKISKLHNNFKLEWKNFVKSFDDIENALDDAKEKLEIYRNTRKKKLQDIVNRMENVEDISEEDE